MGADLECRRVRVVAEVEDGGLDLYPPGEDDFLGPPDVGVIDLDGRELGLLDESRGQENGKSESGDSISPRRILM